MSACVTHIPAPRITNVQTSLDGEGGRQRIDEFRNGPSRLSLAGADVFDVAIRIPPRFPGPHVDPQEVFSVQVIGQRGTLEAVAKDVLAACANPHATCCPVDAGAPAESEEEPEPAPDAELPGRTNTIHDTPLNVQLLQDGSGGGEFIDTHCVYVDTDRVDEFRAALAEFVAHWTERHTRSLRRRYGLHGEHARGAAS